MDVDTIQRGAVDFLLGAGDGYGGTSVLFDGGRCRSRREWGEVLETELHLEIELGMLPHTVGLVAGLYIKHR